MLLLVIITVGNRIEIHFCIRVRVLSTAVSESDKSSFRFECLVLFVCTFVLLLIKFKTRFQIYIDCNWRERGRVSKSQLD